MASTRFSIIPAIDLVAGRVVRLREGDFDRSTDFGGVPGARAAAFAAAGATRLHLVDLDGARAGRPRQLDVLRAVRSAVPAVELEWGGGVRSSRQAAEILEAGADRVVLGTALLDDPELAASLVRTLGADRLIAALDVRAGRAVGHAWSRATAGQDALAAARRLADDGIVSFEVTAIERDGMLAGPDLGLMGRVVALGLGEVVASAGVRHIGDLEALRAAGCAGAIVGRAVYEGGLDLAAAIRATGDD